MHTFSQMYYVHIIFIPCGNKYALMEFYVSKLQAAPGPAGLTTDNGPVK